MFIENIAKKMSLMQIKITYNPYIFDVLYLNVIFNSMILTWFDSGGYLQQIVSARQPSLDERFIHV